MLSVEADQPLSDSRRCASEPILTAGVLIRDAVRRDERAMAATFPSEYPGAILVAGFELSDEVFFAKNRSHPVPRASHDRPDGVANPTPRYKI